MAEWGGGGGGGAYAIPGKPFTIIISNDVDNTYTFIQAWYTGREREEGREGGGGILQPFHVMSTMPYGLLVGDLTKKSCTLVLSHCTYIRSI